MAHRCEGLQRTQLSRGGQVRIFVVLTAVFLASPHAGAQDTTALRGPYFGQSPPGETPVLFAPELFQDPGEYHAPVVFSPDGKEAYWSPMPGHGRNTTLMSRMAEGVWTSQRYVDFGLEAGATEVAISPEGERIFFLSRQSIEGERPAPGDGEPPERIWYAARTSDGIGTSRIMPEVVTAHPTHWQFSVAANGNLYFTSHGPEAQGGADIYVARFDGTTYTEPRPLGLAINSDVSDTCPFIAPDERYLIFTRIDRENYNPDLFISYKQSDGSWTEAERLPTPINSEHTEIYPVVSPDGRYLFFLSWREGAGRIFWVEAGFLRNPSKSVSR